MSDCLDAMESSESVPDKRQTLTIDSILLRENLRKPEDAKVLRLNKQNISTLDPDVIGVFVNLEELYVQDNQLTVFPRLDTLLALRIVDCSNNQLESLAEFSSLVKLMKLNINGNGKITVSDRYELVSVLPSLHQLDDKAVDAMREAIARLDNAIEEKLKEFFVSGDIDLGDANMTSDEVITKLLDLSKGKITCGPEALQKYRLCKVEKSIRERVAAETKAGTLHQFISKHAKAISTVEDPPAKKLKSDLSIKECPVTNSRDKLIDPSSKNFKLSYLLQTHSINNDPKDLETKVWMCEFEPDPNKPGATTSVCATCGGDSVCFIDCKTGMVLKKYKQPKEVFYCLAWTLLDAPKSYKTTSGKASVLAVAGLHGDIKLIDPQQLICYQEVSHHRKPIDALLFHPSRPSWLFSGSEDKSIVLWDVGIPFKSTLETKALRLLTLKACSIVRQIAIIPHGRILVGSCDDGCYVWSIDDVTQHQARTALYKFIFPGDKRLPVDSVSCISDSVVATKRIEEGIIQLWHSESCYAKNDFVITHTLPWRLTDTPFLKFNYSASNVLLLAGDDIGHVWVFDLHSVLHAPVPKAKTREEHGQTLELKHSKKLVCSNKHARLFNHVACSSSASYIVAVADTNVVAVWKQVAI